MASPVAELRAGVIGYGHWGRVHLEAYSRNPRTALVAVCGRDDERTRAAAARYGAAPYTDIDAFLVSGLDLVSVILPDAHHFAPTAEVLRAGVPCLAEKPLTMVRAEAEELLRLAEANSVPFGINFNHRYASPFQRALADARAGQI